jgi:hypothetical protein
LCLVLYQAIIIFVFSAGSTAKHDAATASAAAHAASGASGAAELPNAHAPAAKNAAPGTGWQAETSIRPPDPADDQTSSAATRHYAAVEETHASRRPARTHSQEVVGTGDSLGAAGRLPDHCRAEGRRRRPSNNQCPRCGVDCVQCQQGGQQHLYSRFDDQLGHLRLDSACPKGKTVC